MEVLVPVPVQVIVRAEKQPGLEPQRADLPSLMIFNL